MSKPIIDHYGAYVTEPKQHDVIWWISRDRLSRAGYPAWRPISQEWRGMFAPFSLLAGLLYTTREAAEMSLIRAKCIQRLKEMAYGDWQPKSLNTAWEVIIPAVGGIGVHAETLEKREAITRAITQEEYAAFIYVYKPEEE